MSKLTPDKINGDTSFQFGEEKQEFRLLDFWRWSASNLLDNTMRGILAEYLVAVAVGAKEKFRLEWSSWDLTLQNDTRIEVKSAAYVQNWMQKKPSSIRFGIQPTRGWNEDRGEFDSSVVRQSDYYVFCVLNGKDNETVNPLDLAQWDFYVLSTKSLNQRCGKQKSIGLRGIIKLGASKYSWYELRKWGMGKGGKTY